MRPVVLLMAGVGLVLSGLDAPGAYVPAAIRPPAPPREFRGVWVATVKNIDWPSQAGLSSAKQQAELRAILERAAQLHLNAVMFQVRPACDALYASKLEPWSEYLTGRMGQAPKPYYDPLAFAIEEAHRRGLELHAWFNPFRARHREAKSPIAANHISRTRPGLVRKYGAQLWLDPGDPAVRQYSLAVILDVVKRYNVDGIHLDDYFYPYPERLAQGGSREFPDQITWQRYVAGGGKLKRADWRRQNVNRFLQQLYRSVKAEKRWVKCGISPFGIWRPGYPAQIKGFDAYAELYADALTWLQQGWLDYFAPQLYWAIAAQGQSFPVLLHWWSAQNVKHRHLWPGISCYRHSAVEIANQIKATRRQSGATGNLLWSAKMLRANQNGLATQLLKSTYAQPALAPATPWLDAVPPARPVVKMGMRPKSGWTFAWQASGDEPVWLWVLQTQTRGNWRTQILPSRMTAARLSAQSPPEFIALRAVDRLGNLGPSAVLRRTGD